MFLDNLPGFVYYAYKNDKLLRTYLELDEELVNKSLIGNEDILHF